MFATLNGGLSGERERVTKRGVERDREREKAKSKSDVEREGE